ncbi:MAG: hypothetical protein HKN23_11765 [Verrucomicrobiales bacterium]|nr:hypothetical protein [Verrucomicrobiales bacterium]
MKDWFLENIWLVVGSIVALVVTLVVVRVIVVGMRDDYFIADPEVSPKSMANQHPALRLAGLVAKNLIGGILVIVGIILSLPGVFGQGFLTILIGLMIMDFPGKRKLELKLISLKPVYGGINWMRKRAGKNPLLLPESSTD